MNADHWQRVEQVLDVALDSDPARWPVVLDESCGTDEGLRRDVEALLSRYASAQHFLASPPATAAAALVAEARADAEGDRSEGRRLGPWRIVRQIGRGGMARVFLAERADGAYEQLAALKLLRTGLDSDVDQGRFRAERQILATLSHPNVARLLDGGLTDDGQSYLVLEYVEGEPIDRYCDARALPVRQRLELFLAVAEATQYAHRNLVVHRDLKPSNILVTPEGTVKLLDFGLAKLLEPGGERLAARDTRTAQRWMTPEYAAPEQIRTEPATTATDVYQLGAVLYELLTGRVPFAARGGSVHELEEAILSQEPAAPSSIAEQPASRAALGGDLDAIILKALRKEPDQRYASAQELADDVQRHLSGHPVRACGQTTAYRMTRFARRHRWGLAAALGFVLLLGAYAATVTVQAGRVRRALARATTEARKAEQVTEFMLGLFEANDPGESLGDTITARELMDRGAERAGALIGQPEVQAQLLDVVGRVRTELGAFTQARPVLEQALATRRRLLGDGHPDVAASLANLGRLSYLEGDHQRSASLLREALGVSRAALGPRHPRTLLTLYWLAIAVHEGGDATSARPLFDEWIAAAPARPAELSPTYAAQLDLLAELLQARGELARAEQLRRDAVAAHRTLYGERHPAVASSLDGLAAVLLDKGDFRAAERIGREAVEIQRTLYPDGHPDVAFALTTVGNALQGLKRIDEAEGALREALAIYRRFHGDEHITVATTIDQLAQLFRTSGASEKAEPLFREALRRYRREFGDKNLMVVRTRLFLGDVLRARGRFEEAEPMLLESYATYSGRRGPAHSGTRMALEALVKLYEARAHPEQAARYRTLLAAK